MLRLVFLPPRMPAAVSHAPASLDSSRTECGSFVPLLRCVAPCTSAPLSGAPHAHGRRTAVLRTPSHRPTRTHARDAQSCAPPVGARCARDELLHSCDRWAAPTIVQLRDQ